MGLFDKLVDLLKSWESPKTESQIEATKENISQAESEEHAKPTIGNNKVLQGCSSGCLVAILIGVIVLLVALSLIGQAIDGFFEGVREFFEHPLKTLFSWF
tara:strand:- start:87 stop:389 length:303 start_codon:yes stop_codon:yes gene_type:complete